MQRKTVPIAGWLFADLLLGLAMLFITSMVGLSIPAPGPTWIATLTQTATSTRTATSTATLALVPRTGTPGGQGVMPTPTPTPGFGLNSTPFTVTWRVDPALMPGIAANPNSPAAATARDQLAQQVRECFQKFGGKARAGIVLNFGGNPSTTTGNQLAGILSASLRREFPNVFSPDQTAFKDMHAAENHPLVNGTVETEVYFVSGPEFPLNAIKEFGSTCNPTPTWCTDVAQAQPKAPIYLVSWTDAPGGLRFTLNGKPFTIPFAQGSNPMYACFLVGPGQNPWNATITGRGGGDAADLLANGSVRVGDTLNFCVTGEQLRADCKGDLIGAGGRGK